MSTTLDAISEQIRANQLDQAESALSQVEETDENRADVCFVRGYLKEMRFDREGALECYQQALEADADHAEAAFRSGLLWDTLGDDTAALEFYEKCASAETTHVNALVNLAILYEESNRLEEAERCLRHVLSEFPGHVRASQFLKSVESSYNMVYDERQVREKEKHDAILDTPVSDFELSVRSRNCLRQMNIHTLGDLLRTTEAELLSYKNFGETSLNEIRAMLSHKGLGLGQGIAATAEENESPSSAVATLPEGTARSMATPVASLELSVRSRKCLQRLGVVTLGDLIQHSEAELSSTRNFGETSLNEIKRALGLFGLSFKNSGPEGAAAPQPPSQ